MPRFGGYSSEGVPSNGLLIVGFSANATGSPTCASSNKGSVAIDLSKAGGAFAAAILQSARLSGATVTVGGTGLYDQLSNYETLGSVTE